MAFQAVGAGVNTAIGQGKHEGRTQNIWTSNKLSGCPRLGHFFAVQQLSPGTPAQLKHLLDASPDRFIEYPTALSTTQAGIMLLYSLRRKLTEGGRQNNFRNATLQTELLPNL